MKKIITFLFSITSHSLFAQVNLVPNPSFEDTVSCPNYANQIDKAVGWHASRNTPDYFNGCDWLTSNQSVPNNFRGYQYAHSGVAYVGIAAYSRNSYDFREDFTCQLNSPLNIGAKYLISFYVSCSNYNYRLTCNKLGALFSSINYNSSSPAPISNHCQFYSDSIITDTLNWILIQGSFIADSNYSYLTVGRFFSDSLTDTIYHPPAFAEAYYYIDDINVVLDTTTATSELVLDKTLTIYPNPVSEKLKIRSQNIKIDKIQLFNNKGQWLEKFSTNSFESEIDLDLYDLQEGIYFLKIFFTNGKITYHKLLKK